jgi:CDP-diacylglycerol---glycerol-3-phosphate 3-phosphatidyltransferase
MQWNIPNILTVLRMVVAPMVALVYVFLPRPIADWTAMILFILAALTDYLDGYLARHWKQVSAFGRMLDPIADKAIVIISLAVIMALSGLNPWIIIPVSFIIYREVFVSGLREFLGKDATKLRVTKLAKWKTTAQMVAIPALFLTAIYKWDYLLIYNQVGPAGEHAILERGAHDALGLRDSYWWFSLFHTIGVVMLWVAAVLTVITGYDYFQKALPFLRDDKDK